MRALALILGFVGVCLLAAAPQAAQAQATRTWVSGVGDDANPCSRTAPCKTFAGAISKTAAGGEIDVLDPGGFGTLTITKAMTIDGNTGAIGSVLASGTTGFNINAGASDRIILRNLTVNGTSQSTSPGTTGVNVIAAGSVTLMHVNVMNFSNYCLNFSPSASSRLVIVDSNFDNCTTGALNISLASGGPNKVSVSHSVFQKSGFGISVGANSVVTVADSLISNGATGVQATAVGGHITLQASTVANSGAYGVHASAGGVINLAQTSIVSTTGTAIVADSFGQVASFGNNFLTDNATDGAPNATLTPK